MGGGPLPGPDVPTPWGVGFGPALFAYFGEAKGIIKKQFPAMLGQLHLLRAKLASFLHRIHAEPEWVVQVKAINDVLGKQLVRFVKEDNVTRYLDEALEIVETAMDLDVRMRRSLADWEMRPSPEARKKISTNRPKIVNRPWEFLHSDMEVAGAPPPPRKEVKHISLERYIPKRDPNKPPEKWTPPSESALDERPVLIIGAGNLGRRIALIWASNSRPVTIYDSSPDALIEATEYITDNLGAYCASRSTHPGHVCTTTSVRVATTTGRHEGADLSHLTDTQKLELQSGWHGPWMAIDCLPESLDLKINVLDQFEHHLPNDAILASNSASLMTSEMATHLHYPERLLNTHYFIPPRNRMVELMSSSHTHAEIFSFLAQQMKRVGLTPMIVPPGIQSPGFIFNRIWAATKRETLAVLSEGVAKPGDIDALFRDFFHAEKGPCERMDEVGLDTIAKVQDHYDAAQERRLEAAGGQVAEKESRRRSLEWLRKNYVELDKLGEKTGDGLYTNREREALKREHERGRFEDVEETQGA
ncbi:3-hydroxybutyryl-CoA dehydrogenase [Rhypophila decipiens]|uniref:3-hydroxybutyryl-CoA dehydrogenase n=1 Tax=Rhypophila decipiens TaxID=261697 RepID=A0AAN7B738_9PEZI|nr:3-hydroxybutyryl-CoA dehydrogenase [Rhypophila decipiens]